MVFQLEICYYVIGEKYLELMIASKPIIIQPVR